MASKKIKGITIQIGADTLGLDTALKGIEQKSKKATDELKDINKVIKTTGDSAAMWEQKQKLLNTALEESKKKLQLLEDAQEEVNKQFENGKINEEQYRAFQREVEYARNEVNKYGKELNEANDKIHELGNTSDAAADDMNDLGKETEEAGDAAQKTSDGGLTAMKVALGNLVADGIRFAAGELKEFTTDIVRTGMTYEASMSNVAAISGATSDELEMLSAKAEQMGATTKFTASESADAFGYMALAGWKVEDMLNGIDGVLSLAAASNMDLARASDIVTDYLTAFGLTAQDSARFVDMMSYAMANSNTTTEMLGEAYKNCAATAASMGYSVEDTTAVLMTMANAGVKGGEAGTALNAIMTRLATDTKGCASELSKYNVNVYDSNGKMQSLSSILEGVAGHWETLSDQEQASLAKMLAGTNHYAALQTIMNGLSDSAKDAGMSFEDYTKALEECDGAATDMSHTMIDNLSGDLTILDSAVDGVKISLAKELNPVLRDVVQYITKEMPAIQKKIEPVAKTVVTGLKFAVENIPKAVELAKDIAPIVVGIGAAFAAWKVATIVQGAATAMQALNIAMLANPAVALTAGIVALTAAIVAMKIRSDEEKNALSELDKEYENNQQAIMDNRKALADLHEEYSKKADKIVAEADNTRELWKELDKLTDSSGRVLDKDKERAEFILGKLNEALGTEYSMTGNQIDQYRELSEEIDNVIAKKEAEMLLDQFREMNSEQLRTAATAKAGYETAKQNWDKADQKVNEVADKWTAALRNANIATGYYGEDSFVNVSDYKYNDKYKDKHTKELDALADELDRAYKDKANYGNLLQENRRDYLGAMSYRDKLDEAEQAFFSGDYEGVKDILYTPRNANIELLESGEGTFEELKKAWNNSLSDMLSDFRLALDSGRKDEIEAVLEAAEKTVQLGKQNGLDTSEIFTEEFKGYLQKALDAGADISKLAAWAKDSGVKIGDVFDEEFEDIVQSQLDEGYDTTDLLLWAMESGIDVGNIFTDEFTAKYQAQLDSGFDISKVLEWAKESGEKAGVKFGDSFGSIATKYLYAKNNLINENSINNESDARYMREKGVVSWSHNATGGFIGIGHEGIIAEAGPELVQVMNGGVQITPLTRNARNTPVSEQGGGQTTIYEDIKIYATISNDYDVRRLGERLAAERKSVEISKGL